MNLCMDIDEKLAVLRQVDLFGSFQDSTLRTLCERCNEIYLNEKDMLFREGTKEDAMYLILQGRVVLSTRSKQIGELGPGQYIGEMSVIEETPRSASARALTEVLVMEITKMEFDEYLTAEPRALWSLMRTLSARTREYLGIISDDVRQMSILAHDMRNFLTPLGLVEGFLEDVVEEPGNVRVKAESAQVNLDRLIKVTDNLTDLINQSLRRARKVSMEYAKEPAELADLVEETAEELSCHPALSDKTVKVSADPGRLQCIVNPLDIKRVLYNLIINAAQASPARGSIDVSVRRNGSGMRVGVADKGPGIPEDIRDSLMNDPITTNPEGAGLGLLSCRDIVELRHGGRIWYEPRNGGGTCFYFDLPDFGAEQADQ